MKQANRYRPSKKEVDLQEWIKNRIALRVTPHVEKTDKRKMDRWLRNLLKSDMMKDIVRNFDKNRLMLDDYMYKRPSYIFNPLMEKQNDNTDK